MKLVPLEQILNNGELELVEQVHANPGYVILKAEEDFAVKLLNLKLIKPVRPKSHKHVCTDNVYQEEPCKS